MAIEYVKVIGGVGKWAYWHKKGESVVVDTICNPRVSNFAGQLREEVRIPVERAELHTEGFSEEQPKSIWMRELESETW